MTLDEYNSEPWLAEYVTLAPDLQPGLNLYGATRRFAVLEALGSELGIRIDGAGMATWRLLDVLLDAVGYVVEDGKALVEGQARTVCQAACSALDLEDAVRIAIELGWGRTELRKTTIAELPDAVRNLLAANLTHHVQRMFRRWATSGHLR